MPSKSSALNLAVHLRPLPLGLLAWRAGSAACCSEIMRIMVPPKFFRLQASNLESAILTEIIRVLLPVTKFYPELGPAAACPASRQSPPRQDVIRRAGVWGSVRVAVFPGCVILISLMKGNTGLPRANMETQLQHIPAEALKNYRTHMEPPIYPYRTFMIHLSSSQLGRPTPPLLTWRPNSWPRPFSHHIDVGGGKGGGGPKH